MSIAKPTLFRRLERRVVSGMMAVVAFVLERLVLRGARKSGNQ